mgnify:CR=1 FL=1
MKKKQVIWRRSISVFLALLLCLTLLPAAALAANTTPRITAIGGNEHQNISTTQSGSGWSYDAASTTLTLNGYNGDRIEVEGNKNQNFTLKLVGNNTITAGGSAYGLTVTSEDTSSLDNPTDYMDFTITSDSGARLEVNGIDIVKRVNFIIGGSANVVSETTEKDVCALKGGGVGNCSVTIQDNTNVTLRSGVEQTQNSFCLVPIMGNLTIDTTGEIMIDASSTGGSAIRLGNGNVYTYLRRVKEMTVKWNTGANYLNRHNTTPCASHTGTIDGRRISIYRTGTYVWVLFRNSSGTPKYLNETVATYDRKFMKGDVITISAKAPEAGKRFTHWTWECVDKAGQQVEIEFADNTTARDANAKVIIPDPENIKGNDIYFTANYEDIPATGVTLSETTLALVNGNSGTLTATVEPSEASQSVTWASDNETVATVDEDGTVHAVGAGEATITATAAVAAEGGEKPSASCTVTVKEAEYTVTLDPNEGTIADGKNVTGYTRGTGVELPTAADITREGYLFKGWYEDADFSDSPVTAITATDTGNKTFYAKWAEAYTVTAYGLYGVVMGITPGETFTAKYAAGDTVGLQIGKRDGYTLRSLTLEGISEDALTWTAEGEESEQRGIEFTMPAESVTVTVNWRSNSSGSSSSSGSSYAVSAPSTKNGDVTVSPKNASKGDRVTITVKPDSGYEVGSVTVLDSKGNELKLTDKGDGKYTFTMPGSKVTVFAEFVEEQAASIFADIPADVYYAKAVEWAVKKGITNGKANGLFGSNDPCTRGQIVTFLWRAAGSPAPKGTVKVPSDVLPGSYCYDAVAWAIENGVTNGFADGTFGVGNPCTRGQSVTFLYRAMGTAPTTVNGFTDVAAGDFYAEAVAWAVENGVTNGTTDSTFSPSNGCTRAQIVTFLYRAYSK